MRQGPVVVSDGHAVDPRAGNLGGVILLFLIFFMPGFFTIILAPVDALMGLADRFIGIWI